MVLIGREREVQLLSALISKALSEQRGLGVLITGPSGSGKTTLALFVLQDVLKLREDRDVFYTINYNEKDFIKFLNKVRARKGKVLVLDEFHMCEYQYKLLPLFRKLVVLVVTNRPGDVVEAVKERCIPIELEPLEVDLNKRIFIERYADLPDLDILESLDLSTRRVEFLAEIGKAIRAGSVEEILKELGWKTWETEDGRSVLVSPDEHRYLSLLREYGTVPEKMIRVLLDLDSKYVREIETRLARKRLIEVTSRGRRLYGGASESLEKVVIDI